MINVVLNETRNKLANLDSTADIEELLIKSIESIKKVSTEQGITNFKYPLAALLIEFYVKNPETIYLISLKNRTVSELFQMVIKETEAEKEVAMLI